MSNKNLHIYHCIIAVGAPWCGCQPHSSWEWDEAEGHGSEYLNNKREKCLEYGGRVERGRERGTKTCDLWERAHETYGDNWKLMWLWDSFMRRFVLFRCIYFRQRNCQSGMIRKGWRGHETVCRARARNAGSLTKTCLVHLFIPIPFFPLLLLVAFTRVFSIRAGTWETIASRRFPQEYSTG